MSNNSVADKILSAREQFNVFFFLMRLRRSIAREETRLMDDIRKKEVRDRD